MESEQQTIANQETPLFSRSIAAFYRNLPDLLKKHNRKWVAYHGDDFVAVGGSETELYQECLHRGISKNDFVVLFADRAAFFDHEEIDLPGNP